MLNQHLCLMYIYKEIEKKQIKCPHFLCLPMTCDRNSLSYLAIIVKIWIWLCIFYIMIIALVNIFLRGHANIRRLLHRRTVEIIRISRDLGQRPKQKNRNHSTNQLTQHAQRGITDNHGQFQNLRRQNPKRNLISDRFQTLYSK